MPNESCDIYHASQFSILHFKSTVAMLLDMLLSHPSARQPQWQQNSPQFDTGGKELQQWHSGSRRCKGKMLKTKAVQGYREENKLGFATNCCRRKQMQRHKGCFVYRSHLYNSFLQAVSSKGRIRTIKIRIFNFKYSESTNNSGFLILDDTVNSSNKNRSYFHQNVV